MKKAFILQAGLIFSLTLAQLAHADLDTFISDLNAQASKDIAGFTSTLSSQFGVPMPQVQSIVKKVEQAFCFIGWTTRALPLAPLVGLETRRQRRQPNRRFSIGEKGHDHVTHPNPKPAEPGRHEEDQ